MPLSKFLNNKQEQAPVNAAGASSAYNPFAKLLEDNFMLNKKVQSETLDFLSSETGVSNKPLHLDASKYAPYDVFINDIDTDEELNKERAANQSALEQTGRMVGQMVGSEVILGSLRGFSDILDAGVELFSGDKDFTNPVSFYLEELQNEVRERLEIYRENPEDAWDIADYGWWTNNAVSIASTLSLAIPGGIYAKGLGLLGKSLNASKALRTGLSLVSKHPNFRTKQLESILGLGAHAGLMRTAEGYIEARDTYTQVKDEISNKLAEMSPNEKAELIKRNPSFKGLTDEEIAAKAAGDSAEDVFKDDYWLMLLDAWQLKSLRNLGKGFKNIATTSSIRESQRKSIDALVNRTTAPSKGLKNYFNNLDASSFKVIGAELSEGFEEGYQYVQQQEGIDKARKIIEPNYKARGYAEYITDPHMWEQAFWGWMGGVAFQGLGSAAQGIAAKYIAKNEDLLTHRRKAEIEGRIGTITNFAENISMIRNENKNPFTNLQEAPEITDDAERDALIEYAFEKLVTDMTIEAAKKGNFDLLKEFFASDEFQEHMDKTGVMQTPEQKQYIADVVKHMDEVYDIFEGEINHAIENDIVNQGVIDKIASDNTYIKLASRSAQREIDKYNARINESKAKFTENRIKEEIDKADKATKLEVYKNAIDEINKELREYDAKLKAKTINRAEHTRATRNLLKEKQSLYKDLNFSTNEVISDTEFNTYYNDNKNENAIKNVELIDAVAYESIYNKALQEYNKYRFYEPYIARTKSELQAKARLIESVFNKEVDKRLNNALTQLDDIYENNDVDVVLDYIYGNKNANLTDEVKSTIDKAIGNIKVYDESDEVYADFIVRAAEKKAKEKGARPVATVNNRPVNTPPATTPPANPQPAQPQSAQSTGQSPSPTGGQTPQELGISSVAEEEDKAQLAAERADRAQKTAMSTDEYDDINGKISEDIKIISNSLKDDDNFKSLSNQDKVNHIKEQLRHKGYSEKDINSNDILIKNFVKLINIVANIRRSAIDIDTITKESVIGLALLDELNDEYFDKAIAKFKQEKNVLTLNGKVYFNMITFLRWLAESNEFSTFEALKAVYGEFYNYINNNENYAFQGSPKLSNDIINKIVEQLPLSPVDIDNRVAVLAEKDRTPEYALAINSIKPGDELSVIIERGKSGVENGISFWKTIYISGQPLLVKVAFNKFGKKLKLNNGYLVNKDSFKYEIWQDVNGEYHSSLDEAYEELMADEDKLSQDAIELLSFILDYNKLDKTNYNQLANNNLFKKFFKHRSSDNQNINYDTVSNLLNSIRKIYSYDRGDHFDKRQSYKIWVRKEYNNLKFTDDCRTAKAVSVSFISEGKAIPGPRTTIDKAVVNFNLKDHHLGFVTDKETIRDTANGSERQAPGFSHRGLVVILPNGNKDPHYSRIFAQPIDYTKGFGKAIRNEIKDIISRHITGEDNYDTTLEKLNSIINYSGFIGDLRCIEYNGHIMLAESEVDIPIITIYKKQADKVTDSTGISVRTEKGNKVATAITELRNDTEALIDKAIDNLLENTTYALSFDFIDNSPTANKYVTKKPDNSLTINIGGQVFNYDNYLDFIVKNNVGHIDLGKQDLGYGVYTNFALQENDQLGNANIRGEIVKSSTPRRGREDVIDAMIAEGNKPKKEISTIIKEIAPSFIDYKVLKEQNFLAPNVKIEMKDVKDPITGNIVRAAYDKDSKKIILYKGFFDKAKETDGEYHVMRLLVHENVHRAIAEIDNPFAHEDFLDGLREIRDIFSDALTSGTTRNDKLVEYLKSIGENPEEKIAVFKSMFDNGHSEDYNLEEFIAESLTSKLLQNVLNNIESSRAVSVQTENLSLWQKIIQAIRKLFGFGDIKDNTLLAQEFELFADNFKLKKEEVVSANTEKEITKTVAQEETYEEYTGDFKLTNKTKGKGKRIRLSAIDIDTTPNVVAVTSRLSISERAKFEASLATGRIQMYCR